MGIQEDLIFLLRKHGEQPEDFLVIRLFAIFTDFKSFGMLDFFTLFPIPANQ